MISENIRVLPCLKWAKSSFFWSNLGKDSQIVPPLCSDLVW